METRTRQRKWRRRKNETKKQKRTTRLVEQMSNEGAGLLRCTVSSKNASIFLNYFLVFFFFLLFFFLCVGRLTLETRAGPLRRFIAGNETDDLFFFLFRPLSTGRFLLSLPSVFVFCFAGIGFRFSFRRPRQGRLLLSSKNNNNNNNNSNKRRHQNEGTSEPRPGHVIE